MSDKATDQARTESDKATDRAATEKAAKAKKPETLWDNAKTIAVAVLIALGIRTVVFEPFNIPSSSMEPTLLVGDFLIVSKYSYGYSRYSAPFGLPLFEGRIFGDEPERGDVVVFRPPNQPGADFIKRVIGLPGDRIKLENGRLFINGEMVKREPIEMYEAMSYSAEAGRNVLVRGPTYRETLPNGVSHVILEAAGDGGTADEFPERVVPEGHYFMMGDNRDNSQDSRYFGFVPFENLVGPAQFTFFSLDNGTRFWELWRWPWEIRFDRMFDGIE